VAASGVTLAFHDRDDFPHVLRKSRHHLRRFASLGPEVDDYAARNGVTLPTTDIGELRSRYRFADLQ
jgi:hypothetical protein